MAAQALRAMLVEAPGSFGARARLARWSLFRSTFPGIEDMRVLDLGGTLESWQRSPVRPGHVTVLNLNHYGEPGADKFLPVAGDACQAADALANAHIDVNFDVVYSNSVIEHVGGHARRLEFAGQVSKLAPRHWVQTPYRYHPMEPHWLFPGMQFMPLALRTKVATHWPLSLTRGNSKSEARSRVMSTELLGITDMRHYFPNSCIQRERMFGVTKSIIAVQ